MSVIVDKDLRHLLGSVRDQCARPTCLAFASTAAHEALRGSHDFLSVEYLFYHGVQRSHKNPRRGVSCATLAAALKLDGQPDESCWPYLFQHPKKSKWSAPAVVTGAIMKATVDFSTRTVAVIRDIIIADAPVVVTLGISAAFYLPDSDGRIFDDANAPETARHAVVAVGCGHDERGAYLLVRNSWGGEWGNAGHAWLHDSYLSRRMLSSGVVR